MKSKILIPLVLLSVYWLVATFLFDSDVAFALLSPGQHTGFEAIVIFITFFLLRIVIFFVLPAYVVSQIFQYLYCQFKKEPKL